MTKETTKKTENSELVELLERQFRLNWKLKQKLNEEGIYFGPEVEAICHGINQICDALNEHYNKNGIDRRLQTDQPCIVTGEKKAGIKRILKVLKEN